MYISYLQDRQKLGFACIKDIQDANLISDLISDVQNFIKKTTGILVTYIIFIKRTAGILRIYIIKIIKKGKQLFIRIFSKEGLFAIVIFLNSSSVSGYLDVSRPSFEVAKCCIIESNNSKVKENLKSLTSPSPILDSIIKLNGGYNDFDNDFDNDLDNDFDNHYFSNYYKNLNNEEKAKLEKLAESARDKSSPGPSSKISINKHLQRAFKLIRPIITREIEVIIHRIAVEMTMEFMRNKYNQIRYSESYSTERDLDVELAALRELSEELAGRIPKRPYMPYTLDESSLNTKPHLLSPMTQGFAQPLNEDSLSNVLKEAKLKEMKTRVRREEPLYQSKVLGHPYYYSEKQLYRKGVAHLEKDFGISIKGKTPKQIALLMYNCSEELLQKKDLVVHLDGTMNKQESSSIFGDPVTRRILAFENHLLGRKNYITTYEISPSAFDKFRVSGNIGVSPAERQFLRNEGKKIEEEMIREQVELYPNLTPDARISNKQLNEFEMLQEQKKTDPNFSFTDKQKKLMERGEKYQQQKEEFSKNNPKKSDEEL